MRSWSALINQLKQHNPILVLDHHRTPPPTDHWPETQYHPVPSTIARSYLKEIQAPVRLDNEGNQIVHHYILAGSPNANGRIPVRGEQMWTLRFTLEDGSLLLMDMGKDAHDRFKGWMLQEELDDYADEAASRL